MHNVNPQMEQLLGEEVEPKWNILRNLEIFRVFV